MEAKYNHWASLWRDPSMQAAPDAWQKDVEEAVAFIKNQRSRWGSTFPTLGLRDLEEAICRDRE
eukprot:6097022-Lingulodinium_polyedra.AAC.1